MSRKSRQAGWRSTEDSMEDAERYAEQTVTTQPRTRGDIGDRRGWQGKAVGL